jgi:hypothetical protein
MSETKLSPRPRIELFREAKALGAAMSVKVSPAAKPAREKSAPLLDCPSWNAAPPAAKPAFRALPARDRRSSIKRRKRPESGGKAKPKGLEMARASTLRGSGNLLYLARANQQARQKPKKLYDQNAAALSKGISAREKAAKKRGKNENVKLVLAFVLMIALGAGLSAALPQVTKVKAVGVDGMKNVLQKEILEALSLSEEVNLINADIPAMKARILANPKVASVNIGRAFPDKS